MKKWISIIICTSLYIMNGAQSEPIIQTTATALSKKLPEAQNNFKHYDKWIAVDITHKQLYAYEKTRLVNMFLVSAGAPNTP